MTKAQKYAMMCQRYGLVSILVILAQYNRDENYNECQIILDGLNGMEVINSIGINLVIYLDILKLITGHEDADILNAVEKHIDTIKDYVRGS